jgi:hypothetical protein
MKNQMLKNLVLGITSVFIVTGVVYWFSWWEWVENATDGDSLTDTIWNSLVDGVVKKTGSVSETITWVKTFSNSPIVPTPTTATQVANKQYADTKVWDSWDETIAGIKTFSSSPIVPSPTASGEVASKWYVDSNTGPAPDYDSGWVSINDTSLNNVLKTHNLGTMFPKVELFVWKIVHSWKTYYFDLQTNQYGDANQFNGTRLSFRNSTQFYITSGSSNVVHAVYATATDGTRTRLDSKSSMEVRVLLSAWVN